MLFATLDPKMKILELPLSNNIILSDEFAEITLEKETRKWVLSSIINKKNIYKIIKNV